MYKIGTRGSLLAVTQCTLVKQELEALTGERFELHLIKTKGDQITDKPLWQLEGKDFFTKELDEALLNGTVDLVVHSYKDLGSERPEGIDLAAITRRQYAHDVLLVPKANVEKLREWSGDFIVGTSSPRRIINLSKELPAYLPGHPVVKCATLRGNINTRIQKLKDGQYHAITLALAGVDRLSQLPNSKAELEKLLDGLTFMVLPLSVFPAAAAQGALAIETRADRTDLKKLLKRMHHPATEEEVSRERRAFKQYGGGCHLAVGIHVRAVDGDFLHFHRGETDGKAIEVKLREGATPPAPASIGQIFLGQGRPVGSLGDTLFQKISTNKPAPVKDQHVFVTTTHVLPSLTVGAKTLWAAGAVTHKRIVDMGMWCHGGSDSLGHNELIRLANSQALRMMMSDGNWLVLSHENATSPLGKVFAGYQHHMETPSAAQAAALAQVTHAWWASFPQYEAYVKAVPAMANATHYCGLGKTLATFREKQIPVQALTDHNEFLKMMGKV